MTVSMENKEGGATFTIKARKNGREAKDLDDAVNQVIGKGATAVTPQTLVAILLILGDKGYVANGPFDESHPKVTLRRVR